jgi:hypothetical protein
MAGAVASEPMKFEMEQSLRMHRETTSPKPLTLSLSKGCPSFFFYRTKKKEGRPFDKLRASG